MLFLMIKANCPFLNFENLPIRSKVMKVSWKATFSNIFYLWLYLTCCFINPRVDNLNDFAKLAINMPILGQFSKFKEKNVEKGWGYEYIVLKLDLRSFKCLYGTLENYCQNFWRTRYNIHTFMGFFTWYFWNVAGAWALLLTLLVTLRIFRFSHHSLALRKRKTNATTNGFYYPSSPWVNSSPFDERE